MLSVEQDIQISHRPPHSYSDLGLLAGSLYHLLFNQNMS